MQVPTPTIQASDHGFGAPFFFYSQNEDFCITAVSHSIEEVLGYDAQRTIGTCCIDYLLEDEINADTAEMGAKLMLGSPSGRVDYLRAVRAADDSKRILRIQSVAVIGQSGQLEQRNNLAIDITETYERRRQNKRRLGQLAALKGQLSQRELKVLDLMVDGALNKQIADRVGVSLRTIESDRRRIVEKYGVESPARVVGMEAELRTLMSMIGCDPSDELKSLMVT